MAKIERKYLAHFINAAAPAGEAVYVRMGKDLEEFSPELAAPSRAETAYGPT